MTWVLKANLRGPAGYNATDAAEDDAAIAAFILETAGDSVTGAALDQKYRTAVSVADFVVGATTTGLKFDVSAVVAAMELNGGACYIPPGDWEPDEYNIALDETLVSATLVASAKPRFRYKFFGAGAQSRLRLPAAMTNSDYLFVANSINAAGTMPHPKIVFEDMGVSGAAGGHEGNFFRARRRSFAAIRVYVSALRTGFYADGYCDLIRLEQVYAESMTAGGWLFQGIDNSDGVHLNQVMVYGSNGISLRGAYGATVQGCVSGFHEFTYCNVTLLDNHFEGDGSTVSTPVVRILGSVVRVVGGQYQARPYRPSFQIDDDGLVSPSRVFFDHTVQFTFRIDDPGSSLGNKRAVDVDVARLHSAGEVHFDGSLAYMYAQSTALGGGSRGFGTEGRFAPNVVSSLTPAIQNAITAGRVHLGGRAMLRFANNAWEVTPPRPNNVVIDTKAIPIATLSVSLDTGAESVMTSDLPAGTYYYRAWVVDAAGRANDAAAQVSVTTTVGDPIPRLFIHTFDAPVLLRIVRGTSSGSYNRWCEVVVGVAAVALLDQGSSLSGVEWLSTAIPAFTSGGGVGETRRGVKRLDNGQQTIYATAAPTTGTWAVGDEVINSAPAASQPAGWMCVTAGTPGTWKAKGNLAS